MQPCNKMDPESIFCLGHAWVKGGTPHQPNYPGNCPYGGGGGGSLHLFAPFPTPARVLLSRGLNQPIVLDSL